MDVAIAGALALRSGPACSTSTTAEALLLAGLHDRAMALAAIEAAGTLPVAMARDSAPGMALRLGVMIGVIDSRPDRTGRAGYEGETSRPADLVRCRFYGSHCGTP
jgi:hypothetical protein